MSSSSKDTFSSWDNQVTSPFNTLTRRMYPRTVREVFGWAEEFWMHHGLYSQAIKKAVRYFLTDIEISGDSIDATTADKYADVIEKNFELMDELGTIGDDFIAYGNSFTSLHIPFTRQLICSSCFFKAPITQMTDYYEWNSGQGTFTGSCPKCSQRVNYIREDTPIPAGKIKPVINRWPPQYIEIKRHVISRRTDFYLRVDEYQELYDGIMSGDTIYLEDTPWEIIEAAISKQKFKFAAGQIYHMVNPGVTSLEPTLKGWGLPMFMAEFETALLVHILDKYTEVIAVDYLMPFRVLAPPSGTKSAAGDIFMNMDMGDFKNNVLQMLERHRQNPADFNFLPVPLDYQRIGGEAKDLIPVELLGFYEQRLLHSMGIPPEFYKGGGEAPSAGPILTFKMFESVWQHFANSLNKWLAWLFKRQGEILNWEDATAKLIPVSIYEDPAIRDLKLQLAAGNEISRDTAYRDMGIDIDKERKKVFAEEDKMNKMIEEREKEMEESGANKEVLAQPSAAEGILMEEQAAAEQAAAAGGAGGGPAPIAPPAMPSPSGVPDLGENPSLDEIWTQAEELSNQLLTMDMSARKTMFADIEDSNEILHAVTMQLLDKKEQQAGQQGKEMARAGQMPPAQ
jgi:hypothetical protein